MQRKNKRRQRREQGSKQNNDGMHKNNRQLVLSKSNNELEEDIDIEIRPIRRRDAVEAGLDYWMDETDLVKERQQRKAVKNRKVCDMYIMCVYIADAFFCLISYSPTTCYCSYANKTCTYQFLHS